MTSNKDERVSPWKTQNEKELNVSLGNLAVVTPFGYLLQHYFDSISCKPSTSLLL